MNDSKAPISAGDGDFAGAVGTEIPALYRYARSLVGDSKSAEWLVGDTLSKAWEKWGSIRDQSGLRTWLHRILHNLAVDSARRNSREVSVEDVESQWRDDTFSVDPEKVVEIAEDREELRDSLLRLPFEYRTVLLLHDVEGWRLSEVASSLGISLPAVKQRLRRGRMMLVSALSEGAVRRSANANIPLTCWEARGMVSDYLDGGLAGSSMEVQLRDHLSSCTTCPPLYASLVGVKASLSGMRDPDSVIPPAVMERIRSAAVPRTSNKDQGI